MICDWDGCKNESTAVWEITDSFGRVYQKDACDKCAAWWKKHRPRCVKIRDLTKKVSDFQNPN
jgi:hypothetical protein